MHALFSPEILQAGAVKGIFGDSADMSEDSGTLKTVAIRLLALYGEMDSTLLPHVVSLATANDGHLVCVGSMKSKCHMMYVGNAAWALICAYTKLNKIRLCTVNVCVCV